MIVWCVAFQMIPGALMAQSGGFYYVVKRGDSLSSIATRNGITRSHLASANRLQPNASLIAGSKLYVPRKGTASSSTSKPRSSSTTKPSTVVTPRKAPAKVSTPTKPAPSREVDVPGGGVAESDPEPVRSTTPPPVDRPTRPSERGFIWPVEGRVLRRFVDRSDEKYTGIDLSVPVGTEVRAAKDGKVVFAGDTIPGYGRLIIIEHVGGLASTYGHNDRLLAKKGQDVKRGQVIARSGNSGRGGDPYLHFEIRRNREAVNPEPYLP